MGTHTIGKKIRACREERGMSQEVFAEKVGISPAYVGMIERGEKIPRLETFLRIANTLEVSADRLLSDALVKTLEIDTSVMSERIAALSPEGRARVYDVVETLLKHETV